MTFHWKGCVNALYRANVISTPLLQNPVFMRVSGTVFARIFLNCQISGCNKAKKWAGYKLYLFRYNFDVYYTIIIHQFIRQATSQIQILYAEIIAFKTLFSAPYQRLTTISTFAEHRIHTFLVCYYYATSSCIL